MSTPLRSMRIPDNPWKPAMERATREGTTLTAVVIAFLRRYAAGAAVLALVMASISGSAEASAPVAAVVAPMSATATFVATVRQIGAGTTINDQTDAYLINGGKSICSDFKGGMTRASMWNQVSPYYSPRMFDGVVRAAVGAFCPSYLSVL